MEAEIFDQHFWLGILTSVLCGFVVGIERQTKGKPVGIRTSILICFGTMLYIYLGSHINEGRDVVRVLGQVVTGIGFLGAGVIMTRGNAVTGMTSAAVVWLLAGIGAAIGFQFYLLAIIITIVAIGILIGVEFLEEFYLSLRKGLHSKR